eukprot:g45875.t1
MFHGDVAAVSTGVTPVHTYTVGCLQADTALQSTLCSTGCMTLTGPSDASKTVGSADLVARKARVLRGVLHRRIPPHITLSSPLEVNGSEGSTARSEPDPSILWIGSHFRGAGVESLRLLAASSLVGPLVRHTSETRKLRGVSHGRTPPLRFTRVSTLANQAATTVGQGPLRWLIRLHLSWGLGSVSAGLGSRVAAEVVESEQEARRVAEVVGRYDLMVQSRDSGSG